MIVFGQIQSTLDLRLNHTGNVFSLEISKATLEDSGKYTIRAKNKFGQCSATASLLVHSKCRNLNSEMCENTSSRSRPELVLCKPQM